MMRIRDFARVGERYLSSVTYRREPPYDLLPRYVRDPSGERRGYRKLDFQGLERVDEVDEILRPDEAELEGRAAEVADLLEGRGVPRDRIGVTGSRLLGLETGSSDVDTVVYGREAFDAAREEAAELVEEGELESLDRGDWEAVYEKRSPELGFEEFLAHERRKGNRFKLRSSLVDLLFVRSDGEVDWSLADLLDEEREGEGTVRGEVVDASFSYDSPAVYELEGEVERVYSFTHTYAGQVREGEELEARGFFVRDGRELVVGSTREASGEYVRSLDLPA